MTDDHIHTNRLGLKIRYEEFNLIKNIMLMLPGVKSEYQSL